MYTIAVCDDESLFVKEIARMTREILDEEHIDGHILEFDRTDALYQALRDPQIEIHLLLLDILLGGETGDDGMRLAARLRQEGNQIGIVLISQSSDFLLRGYDVQAIKYILKPVDRAELKKAVVYDYGNHYKGRYLAIQKGTVIENVLLSEILYMEIVGRKVAIYLCGGVVYYQGRLAQLEEELPAGQFVRCHQSFLINLDNVTRLVRYAVTIKGGREIPVSKRAFKRTQETLLHYLESRFRG